MIWPVDSDGERMKATNPESLPNHGRASRGRFFALAFLLVVLLISLLAPEVHADALAKPTNVVAREHQTTGNRYYRLREFEKAIEEYKAGAVREDAPVFYYNLGQCYRQLGRNEDAIWHYERFLERGKPTGEVEASVRDFIAQMKGELEKKAMKQPPVEVAPPSPASPGMLAAAPPPEGGRGTSTQRKIAITMAPVGLAVVGLGLGLGLRAHSFEDDAAEICPMNPCARSDDANTALDRGKTNARYANVAVGVGGAAILGAVVLWISGPPAERKRTAVVPQVSRTFAGVTASLRF
jgi:tetratricopeptide (TPR) repeat protein